MVFLLLKRVCITILLNYLCSMVGLLILLMKEYTKVFIIIIFYKKFHLLLFIFRYLTEHSHYFKQFTIVAFSLPKIEIN